MDSTAVNMAIEHANRFLMLVEAVAHLKQSLSLAWFLGNISTITLLIYGMFLFKLSNKRLHSNVKKENSILNFIGWFAYLISSIVICSIVTSKMGINGIMYGLATLICSIIGAIIFIKRNDIISHVSKNTRLKNGILLTILLISSVLIISTKNNYGMWPALALLLLAGTIGFFIIKWNTLFKRTDEKRLPLGWLILLVMITVVQSVVFNTFPGIILQNDFKGAVIDAINSNTVEELQNSNTTNPN